MSLNVWRVHAFFLESGLLRCRYTSTFYAFFIHFYTFIHFMHLYIFMHSSTDGCFHCLQIGVVSKATVNIWVQKFCLCVSFLLDKYLAVELLDHSIGVCWGYKNLAEPFSKWLYISISTIFLVTLFHTLLGRVYISVMCLWHHLSTCQSVYLWFNYWVAGLKFFIRYIYTVNIFSLSMAWLCIFLTVFFEK